MSKPPKAKADEQKPEFKRYSAPKHAGDVHLPSGVKKIRRGIVELPADALAEHELLIRAGFELVGDGAAAEPEQDNGDDAGSEDAPADPPAE